MLAYFILLFVTTVCLALANNAPIVPVQPFTPVPIRITLADLPPPYQTPSASKSARVVGVPKDATLLVPSTNFRVTIYRDGMQGARQMIYTPTGDILVTGNGGNRISILTGDDTAVFADGSNAIAQAFGMAFVDVSSIEFYQFFWKIYRFFRVGSMLRMLVIFVDIHIKPVIEDYWVLDKLS
jgi:hypothetical protein